MHKILRFINSGLTFRRIVNTFKYFYSYRSNNPFVYHYPPHLYIEPTNICNLKCPLCPTGLNILKRKQGVMSIDTFSKVINEVGPFLLSLSLYHYGEPLLNRNIFKMIEMAKKGNNIPKVALSSNGMFIEDNSNAENLVESGLDEIWICIDGLNQETLRIYRKNADINKIIRGIKSLKEVKLKLNKPTPKVVLQFIVMKHNEKQIHNLNTFKEYGVDEVLIKSCDVGLHYPEIAKLGPEFIPEQNLNKCFKVKNDRNIELIKEIPNGCQQLWKTAVVCWDGSVVPCCYDADHFFNMGNVNNDTFIDIWTSSIYSNMRKSILNNRRKLFPCSVCVQGIPEDNSMFYKVE